MPDGCLATGKRKRQQGSQAFKSVCPSAQQFTAPDGAIWPIARTVPGKGQDFAVQQLVFCHAGDRVSVMMLHADYSLPGLFSPVCRKKIGMQVAGKNLWLEIVKLGQVLCHSLKNRSCLGAVQVAQMLSQKSLGTGPGGNGVLLMAAGRQNRDTSCSFQG